MFINQTIKHQEKIAALKELSWMYDLIFWLKGFKQSIQSKTPVSDTATPNWILNGGQKNHLHLDNGLTLICKKAGQNQIRPFSPSIPDIAFPKTEM